jgi:thiamine kinase-like enzyme
MLAEPRFAAGDLGAYFYVHSVRDAVRCLEGLRPPSVRMAAEGQAVRDALLAHLSQLLDDEPRRVHLLQEQSGPETLLHGDLTRANVFVLPESHQPRVRLIDWDHVGVGPAGFDISTHVAHYPSARRQRVLERYALAMAERGHPFPDDVDWGLMVDTFEAGRLANQVIWIALGIVEGNEWGFRDLATWADALAAAVTGEHDGVASEEQA